MSGRRRVPIIPAIFVVTYPQLASLNILDLTNPRSAILAAVIFNESADTIAAISLSGPMARIPDDRIPLLGDKVRAKADAITGQFGGTTPNWRKLDAVGQTKSAADRV